MKKILRSLGPGIITAALVFGPGSLTVASKLGAAYSYDLLWVVVIAVVFMMVFTSMNARIGIASERSLLTVMRDKWGRASAVLAGLGIFLVTASFQAGNVIGVGMAFAELYETSLTPWAIAFTLLGMSLLFFKSFYKVLEKIMLVLVGLMLVAFLITLIRVKPSLTAILSGLAPGIPSGSMPLIIAVVASNFSMVGAFYQSYLVQERGWKRERLSDALSDSYVGIVILGLIGSMVLMSAAAVLHSQSTEINTAADMARALEPLLGTQAKTLFMYGLFGASFSSLIGNATIGGALLSDALGYGDKLQSNKVRGMIAMVMVLGAVIALAFGRLPLELIIFAQGVTIFIVPFIGISSFLIANDRKLMGDLVNSRLSNILGALGLIILVVLAFSNIKNLFL